MTVHPMLELTDEVATALREGRPVVALESTIISHGMCSTAGRGWGSARPTWSCSPATPTW